MACDDKHTQPHMQYSTDTEVCFPVSLTTDPLSDPISARVYHFTKRQLLFTHSVLLRILQEINYYRASQN